MTRNDAEALCATGRRAVDLGLSPGASGNLSVKSGDLLLATPSGISLGALDPQHLAVLDTRTGEPRGSDGPRPTKEVPLHLALYRRFPNAAAVVHLHSAHAIAWSCREPWSDVSAIPPLTPYLIMRVGRVPLAPYAAPGTPELGSSLDTVPGDFHAVLLARHGSLAWGRTIDEALDIAVEVEEACRTALLAGVGATPLSPAEIETLTTRYATEW